MDVLIGLKTISRHQSNCTLLYKIFCTKILDTLYVYPNKVEVTSADELKEAVKFDHVCGEFQKNYRSISNFKKTNVVVMDCDNDHSENPDDWITMESLEERFEDIDYAVAPSRHHMVEKDGKAARPKFHVYFPIEETDSAERCAAIKRAIHKAYPFFDDNALDLRSLMRRMEKGLPSGDCSNLMPGSGMDGSVWIMQREYRFGYGLWVSSDACRSFFCLFCTRFLESYVNSLLTNGR